MKKHFLLLNLLFCSATIVPFENEENIKDVITESASETEENVELNNAHMLIARMETQYNEAIYNLNQRIQEVEWLLEENELSAEKNEILIQENKELKKKLEVLEELNYKLSLDKDLTLEELQRLENINFQLQCDKEWANIYTATATGGLVLTGAALLFVLNYFPTINF